MTDEKTRWAFKRLFATDEGAVVLRVLGEFARADEAEFCSDPRKDAYLQGRRSVVLEIRKILEEQDEV